MEAATQAMVDELMFAKSYIEAQIQAGAQYEGLAASQARSFGLRSQVHSEHAEQLLMLGNVPTAAGLLFLIMAGESAAALSEPDSGARNHWSRSVVADLFNLSSLTCSTVLSFNSHKLV